MQGIYNYIPETNRVYRVHIVAAVAVFTICATCHVIAPVKCVLYVRTFTLSLSVVCVQCPIWLFFVFPKFRAFLVCRPGIV
jgi:hypothetical protein